MPVYSCLLENKRELVVDLVRKAKQIETIIESLPPPEPEEAQVGSQPLLPGSASYVHFQAARFSILEQEIQKSNQEYEAAVERASTYTRRRKVQDL